MKSLLGKIRNRLFAGLAKKQDIDTLYGQLNGLIQIQNAIQGKPVLRPLRGWAISPDALSWVLADLQERKQPTVIEFGSGQSTVILAAVLKHRGGRLVSVEHDPVYSSVIQRQVAACGLSDYVETIHAPLVEVGDSSTKSYDTSKISNIEVDIALIDGPPIILGGAHTRLAPLRWSAAHLVPNGAIFLDDSNRASEQGCIESLIREYPKLTVLPRAAEKGLVEIRNK
jgi:precorrin-6B methylase 2